MQRTVTAAVVLSLMLNAASLAPSAGHPRPDRPNHGVVEEPPAEPPPPPAPPDDPGMAAVSEVLQAPPDRSNRVRKLTEKAVKALEANTGVDVIENVDGLVVMDASQGSERVRIALMEERTPAGTNVIGIAVLDEEEIQEVEAAASASERRIGIGPSSVSAHVTNSNHYHYFWQCSYVYQYANSWNMLVNVCSTDRDVMKFVGSVVATVVSVALRCPILCIVGGLVYNLGWDRFSDSSGRVRFYLNGDVIAQQFGSVYYYNGPFAGWWYDWSRYSPNYCLAQRQSTGINYYIGFGYYGCGGGSSGSF